MHELLFHGFFVIVFSGMMIIRLAGWAKTSPADQIEFKETPLNMVLRGLLGLSYIAMLCVYAVYPRFLSGAIFPLPEWLRWAGCGLGLISVGLLGWVHWALAKNFSTTLHIREGHTLVTHGPYRWVRHPMYTVLVLFFLGLLLISANWMVGIPALIALPLILVKRLGSEEALMIEQFGSDYREYMKRTGRFLPRLRT